MISNLKSRIHGPRGELIKSLDNTRQVIFDLYIQPDHEPLINAVGGPRETARRV